jgi:predicted kinase
LFVFRLVLYNIRRSTRRNLRQLGSAFWAKHTQHKPKAAEPQAEADAEAENSNKKTKIILETSQARAESDNEELFNAAPA